MVFLTNPNSRMDICFSFFASFGTVKEFCVSSRKTTRAFAKHGFAEIGLFVVIAIISILISLLLPPTVQTSRSAVRRICYPKNNLQIAFAVPNCEAENKRFSVKQIDRGLAYGDVDFGEGIPKGRRNLVKARFMNRPKDCMKTRNRDNVDRLRRDLQGCLGKWASAAIATHERS